VYTFGPFRLEPAKRRLLREGRPLPLTPKAFDVLVLLVQHRERVVEKEEVMRRVWPDCVVEEANLAQNIFTLRKVLGDTHEGARYIATVPRRGYRFVAEVAEGNGNGSDTASSGLALDTAESGPVAPAAAPEASLGRRTLIATLALALPALGFLAGAYTSRPPQVSFQKLTFRRGTVTSGRFAPDGRTVVYGAAWDGGRIRAYSTRTDSRESRDLELADADLMAVSPSGELAVLFGRRFFSMFGTTTGTLARVPLTGGAPRELLRDAQFADWAPGGKELAIVRQVGEKNRLEYPIGTPLYESVRSHCVGLPRVAPDGDAVAFVQCEGKVYGAGGIALVGRSGKKTMLAHRLAGGLAWNPRTKEVWFTIEDDNRSTVLYAVNASGREREVFRLPVPMTLLDVSKDGSVLVTMGTGRAGIMGLPPGAREEQELSWFDRSFLSALSDDGRTLLFGEAGDGRTDLGVYLRTTDGSPAVRLGDGAPHALSPDGAWVLASAKGAVRRLTLLPTGPGEPRSIEVGNVSVYRAWWFSDGRRVLLGAEEPERGGRLWILDLKTAALKPLTPEFTGLGVPSPDGSLVATTARDGGYLYPTDGSQRRPIPGFENEDWPIQWSADGRKLFVRRQGELPVPIYAIDLATGRRELFRRLAPHDRAGIVALFPELAPDNRAYAYAYYRNLTDLYLVTGLE
jgi:DNA-binding winged helix-turn-helix (wHTH) protein/Tol biopolymer transport system component